jgi:hypothetical protein
MAVFLCFRAWFPQTLYVVQSVSRMGEVMLSVVLMMSVVVLFLERVLIQIVVLDKLPLVKQGLVNSAVVIFVAPYKGVVVQQGYVNPLAALATRTVVVLRL